MTLLESKSFSSIDSSATLVYDEVYAVEDPRENTNRSPAVLVKEIRNAVRGWVGSKVIILFSFLFVEISINFEYRNSILAVV